MIVKIASGLAAVFLGGVGVGHFVTGTSSEPTPPVAAATWSVDVLDRLTKDLGLTPKQQAAFAPALEMAGQKISDQRDRTLFQIHLEVLGVHDRLLEIPGELTPAQSERLTESRNVLQETIISRFSSFLENESATESDS